MKYFRLVAPDLAIDLGTANILVYQAKKGIVINEPTVLALDVKTGVIEAFGQEAYNMIGKTPENIIVVKPLENGVVSDFDMTKLLLSHFINKALPGINLIQPKVVITAPSGISDVEKRAIEDACIYSGAREVYIVEATLAAAIGAGMKVEEPKGHMIVNMGAGTTEAAIISLNGIVASKTINYGGDSLNNKIEEYLESKYQITLGSQTVESVKIHMSNLLNKDNFDKMEISGREIKTGMPKTITVGEDDIFLAIRDEFDQIIDIIRYILEKNPPELSRDVIGNGIYLTGGASLVKGLDNLISKELSMPVVMSKTPFEDSIKGVGKILENLDKHKKIGK